MRRKPRALRPGAKVGMAAPGGPVDPETVAAGVALWEEAGFRVFQRPDLSERQGYLAGGDERRAAELMQLVQDPEIEAIVCARGGYGCDRILDRLDPQAFREAAKPLVGYSDVTALLLWQRRRAGLVGFHGPMLEYGGEQRPEVLAGLVAQLTGTAEPPRLCGTGRTPGRAEGPLVGGSLTLVVASLGTPWEIETEGAILLLEEVGERPYRVDRMLQQLRGAGKLAGLAGIGFGDLSTCLDERYETTIGQVVAEAVAPLGVPCVTELPFGHVPENAAWPMGGRATLDGSTGELTILERGVEDRT
ncbi:MAG: S66 peptidase family protein [Myxococcota bacterium]